MSSTQIKSTKPIKFTKNLGITDLNLIALAEKSINLPRLIASLINKHNCTIMHSKILELGEDLTFAGSISGKWNEIIKLEKSIANLTKKYPIHIYIKHNNNPITNNDNSLDKPYINYVAHATALNNPMLFDKLFDFFDKHQIPIKSATINANPENLNLITLELQVKISVDLHIMSLRENFLILCDNLNLDTSLEPL